MKRYTITNNRRIQKRSILAYVGETQGIIIDYAPFELYNGTVLTASNTVESGQQTQVIFYQYIICGLQQVNLVIHELKSQQQQQQ